MIRYTSYLLLLFVFIINSCKKKEEKVSKEDAKAFAAQLEKEVDDYKINFIEKNVHLPVLLKKINSHITKKELKGSEQGVRTALAGNNYERAVYEMMGGNGEFKCTRQYEKEGVQHVIFRVYGANGLNYLDMELAKLKNKTGIADMFLHATGEDLSKSLAGLLESLLQHQGTALEASIVRTLNNFKKYRKNADYEKAKAEFMRLPYSLRNSKMYEVTYLDLLSHISEEEYTRELERITTKYEAQSGYDLLLLDVYLMKKEYGKAIKSIDAVDSIVRTDPFLDYYRGLIYKMNGDTNKAVDYFNRVTVSMPDFAGNYAELISHYGSEKDKENAKKYYAIYKTLNGKDREMILFFEEEYPYLAE